jgi:predicted TIM-barrel fold metal-dependent hydrolase
VRVIDCHTHPVFMRDGFTRAAAARLVAHGRQLGIERMVVLGDVLAYGRNPNRAQMQAINDQTRELCRWHPGYFIGFCYVNPNLGERAVRAEIDRAAAAGLRGVKLEIDCNARDARLRPVMLTAERLGWPVLQHSWDQTNIRQRRYHSDPADTALLARRFPNVRVIMAHLTGCGFRGVLEVKALDNLVVDTSGGQPEAGLIEHAVEHLGAGRVLHGSDLPIRDPACTIGRILGSAISPGAKEQILRDNAHRLLGLP